MRLAERLLAALSRPREAGDYGSAAEGHATVETALSLLRRVFPTFLTSLAGARVADFGCGHGAQAIAMARHGAREVLGIELNDRTRAEAERLAAEHGVTDRVRFAARAGAADLRGFDVVVSQDSMEHFSDPGAMLQLMRELLRPTGVLFVTFGPPWYAPYGSHMHFFTRVPWVHLLFPESTVLHVRARYRDDGARRYEEVESGLNRMSLAKFERLVAANGFEIAYKRLDAVKGVTILTRVPLLRELLTNHVSYTLRLRAEPASR